MTISLPQILRDNMDKWEYDDNGKMIALNRVSFEIIKAIQEINQMEESNDATTDIIY